ARRTPRGATGSRHRRSRSRTGRGSHGMRHPYRSTTEKCRNCKIDPGLVPGTPFVLQGARLRRLPRRAAGHLDQQGAESQAGRLRGESVEQLRSEGSEEAKMTRRGYEGVAVAVPVTVPYARYSIRS